MADKPYHKKETLERCYYEDGMTQKEIADKYDVSHQTISDWMNRHNINPGIEAGQFDKTPGVSFFTSKDGYEIIAAWNAEKQQMEHVKHHRLLMACERAIGDIEGMHVHHMNYIKWDNRTENLEVKDPSEHSSKHAKENAERNFPNSEKLRELAKDRERDEKGRFIPNA